MAYTSVACLCILAATLSCIQAETYVYENDFKTGIPEVYGHSVVRVEKSGTGSSDERLGSANFGGFFDSLMGWAMQQVDTMMKMTSSLSCEESGTIILVDGVPVGSITQDCTDTAASSNDNIQEDAGSPIISTDDYKAAILDEGIPSSGQSSFDAGRERSVAEHRRRLHYLHRIMQIILIAICAITIVLCLQQARELRKAIRASKRVQFCKVSVSDKTPLLKSLPHEGAQEIPIIAVASLDVQKPSNLP